MFNKNIATLTLAMTLLTGCTAAELSKIITDAKANTPSPSASLSPRPLASSDSITTPTPATSPILPGTFPTVVPSGSIIPSVLPTTAPTEAGLLLYLNMEKSPSEYLYNGFPVTFKGISPHSQGRIGQAWNFDGKESYMKINLDINPSQYPQLTMSAWARYTGPDSDGPFQVISHDDGGYDRSLGIDTRGNTGRSWSTFVGSAGVLGSTEKVEKNAWAFLTSVYDQKAKTVTLYVNGVRKRVENAELGGGHPYLYIGSNPSFGEHFTGDIDEVKIFGRALSPEEIQTMGGMPPAPGPITLPVPAPIKFFDNGNIQGVLNGSPCAPTFTTDKAYLLTEIMNYHWNDAKGQTPPGKIGLKSSTGEVFGPWDITTSPGQGGVPNAYWYAKPIDTVLPSGTYTITDSQPDTWSYNPMSKCSMSWVSGIPK